MEEVSVRLYQESDRAELVRCVEGLQDYLVVLDPLKRIRNQPQYATVYTKKILQLVERSSGSLFVATLGEQLVGYICGIIENQSKTDLLESIPSKDGRILDLFVASNFRNKRVGQMLMVAMEKYFRDQHCTIIRVEVFAPNTRAHDFYVALDYGDRTVDMIKTL